MKQSEQIARLQQRVTQLEMREQHPVPNAPSGLGETAWLGVYGQVLQALIIVRRAVTEEQLPTLEAIAASAATRACGERHG